MFELRRQGVDCEGLRRFATDTSVANVAKVAAMLDEASASWATHCQAIRLLLCSDLVCVFAGFCLGAYSKYG